MDDPLSADELLRLVEQIAPKPTDPIEVRCGSKLVLNSMPFERTPAASVNARLYGLPVIIDSTVPFNRIEVRARDGSVLAAVDMHVNREGLTSTR